MDRSRRTPGPRGSSTRRTTVAASAVCAAVALLVAGRSSDGPRPLHGPAARHLDLNAARADVTLEALTNHMAGGAELTALKHELAQARGVDVTGLPEESDLPATASAVS